MSDGDSNRECSEGESEEVKNRKIINPLKPVDFSQIILDDFDKNFYQPHEDIANMTPEVKKKIMYSRY